MELLTDEDFAEWGRKESEIRQKELENVGSADDLACVQRAARKRRKAVGLSASQAAFAVAVAQRIARGDSLAFAMRKK